MKFGYHNYLGAATVEERLTALATNVAAPIVLYGLPECGFEECGHRLVDGQTPAELYCPLHRSSNSVPP